MKKRIAYLMMVFISAFCLNACGKKDKTPENTFKILAGSELKDMKEIVEAFAQKENINIEFEYTGTLDAVDRLNESTPTNQTIDAVWVSHSKYLQLIPSVRSHIKQREKTMYSRVVLGVKPEVVASLGWQSGKVGWKDIITAAKQGKFRFAMTNPTGSNTGFVALVGLATELSGKGDALTASDIPNDKLRELFIGQTIASGSSGTLADKVLASPTKVDGMINYESVIQGMKAKGLPLTVIFPKEGVITADYPLMLLDTSSKANVYKKLVDYLRSPDVQKQIALQTYRTPLNGNSDGTIVNELPFPNSLETIDAILKGFLDDYAKPTASFFVLDVSGSMAGERLNSLKEAIQTLAQGDETVSSRFSMFRAREHIQLQSFSNMVFPAKVFTLTANAQSNKKILAQIASAAQMLTPQGGTAIYDGLKASYPDAQMLARQGQHNTAIILMTDGQNTSGSTLQDFQKFVQEQGEPIIPIYGILYGEASADDMQALANLTKGKVFDARKTSLKKVMKEIRTYQ